MDYTSSMQQSFEVYEVDPLTWGDKRLINDVSSVSITRDGSTNLLESAAISCSEVLGEVYIRVYLVATQNDRIEKIPLGTFLVQTPTTTFDGKETKTTSDAYSPLIEIKDKFPPIGYTVNSGENVIERAGAIVKQECRQPVIVPTVSKTLYDSFTTNGSETWLDYIIELVKYADYSIGLDELSRVIFLPNQSANAMQPRWTFTDDNSSILYENVSINRDLYGIPNKVEVIYSNGSKCYTATAVNDKADSEISTVSRGREVQKRIVNPSISGVISQAKVQEYAEQQLEELSTLTYTVTYSHGYCPVRVGDCVRLEYKSAGLDGINAIVKTQSINCATGISVSETATFVRKLWER